MYTYRFISLFSASFLTNLTYHISKYCILLIWLAISLHRILNKGESLYIMLRKIFSHINSFYSALHGYISLQVHSASWIRLVCVLGDCVLLTMFSPAKIIFPLSAFSRSSWCVLQREFCSDIYTVVPQLNVFVRVYLEAFRSLQRIPGFYDAFYKGDYCNIIDSSVPAFGVIIGLLPLIGQAVYTTESHHSTVIGSALFHNLITFYIGTKTGYVVQV